MHPARLVFCGGGTRCLVFLQTLVELERTQRLVNVKEYWGASAGALLASLLAVSKSATIVKQIMFSADYLKFRNIDVSNIFNINKTWGLDDGASLTEEIERLFELMEPGSKTKTLADISGLNIVVADLNTHDTVVCNSESYPSLRVVDAIRASMSLPMLFRPYKHAETGHYWVDGGLRAHFPWDLLPDDAARSEALGFTFIRSWSGGPKTFTEYLFSMIHFDEPKKMQQQRKDWSNNILWYPSPPFPAWYVRLCKDDYELIDSYGQRMADEWLAKDVTFPVSLSNTPGKQNVCAPQNTHLQSDLGHPTSGPLDNRIQTILQLQESSSPQSPQSQPYVRRWSV